MQVGLFLCNQLDYPAAAQDSKQCYFICFSQILSHELPFRHSVAFPPPQIAQAGMWLWTM